MDRCNSSRFAALAALLAAGCSGAQAPASSLKERLTATGACYARAYDAAHLAAHPRQTVTRFYLGDAGEAWRALEQPGQFHIGFGFRLTGRSDPYSGVGVCAERGAGASCDIEGDGGSFTIEPNGEGLRIEVARMQLEGSNDFSPDLALGDNRVILVAPAPASDCPQS